jgi:hypothetical protein
MVDFINVAFVGCEFWVCVLFSLRLFSGMGALWLFFMGGILFLCPSVC